MLTFTQRITTEEPAQHMVDLSFHQRTKARLRTVTAEKIDVGIIIDRGELLLHGDKLTDGDGQLLEIRALAEPVSVASTNNNLLFAKACYHVGNRHTEVQIETGRLIYLRDHVLDDMLNKLGLDVSERMLAFTPENGAYSKGHSHSHGEDEHHHAH